MPIPDYQSLMRPLLQILEDDNAHSLAELHDHLCELFLLTPEEISERINSGRQTVIRNRVGWARTYLHKAGLLELPSRGNCSITALGHQALIDCPERVDNKYLRQFPEFVKFQTPKASPVPAIVIAKESDDTPEEQLQNAYSALNQTLASELLDTVKQGSPAFFEQLVVDLMLAMGYGGSREEAGKATKLSADGGIDGMINEDRLGLDTIYLQAKRWEGTVGRPEIQKFAGALQGFRAKKGVFITTSDFSSEALNFVENIENKIVLINGEQLTELMVEYSLGVNTKDTYVVKTIDSDYFIED
tara:strand:+ start:155 stop:1060 length:906 start_codon:yes stop_codon:yes gene_type:complete